MAELFEQQDSQTTATTEATPNVGDSTISTDTTSASTGNWLDSMPEDFRQEGFVTRHNDMASFMNSMKHAQSMLGRKNGIPDFENDSPELINSFRDQLGTPHDASGYQIQTPEGYEPDETFHKFTELAHKGHLANDVTNEMYQLGVQQVTAGIESFKASEESKIDEAFSQFAQDPNYSDISANAQNILQQVDPEGEVLSVADLSELGVNAPKVARFLDKMSKLIGDDSVVKTSNAATQGNFEERYAGIRQDVAAGRISADTGNERITALTKQFMN